MDSEYIKAFIKDLETGDLLPYFSNAMGDADDEETISEFQKEKIAARNASPARVGKREVFEKDRPGQFGYEIKKFGEQPGFSAVRPDLNSQEELWYYLKNNPSGGSGSIRKLPRIVIHKVKGKEADTPGLEGDWHAYLTEMEPQEEHFDMTEYPTIAEKKFDRAWNKYDSQDPMMLPTKKRLYEKYSDELHNLLKEAGAYTQDQYASSYYSILNDPEKRKDLLHVVKNLKDSGKFDRFMQVGKIQDALAEFINDAKNMRQYRKPDVDDIVRKSFRMFEDKFHEGAKAGKVSDEDLKVLQELDYAGN